MSPKHLLDSGFPALLLLARARFPRGRIPGAVRPATAALYATCVWLGMGTPRVHADDAPIGVRLSTPEIAVSTLPHPRSEFAWGRSVSTLAAPFGAVVSLVHDFGRYPDLFPKVTRSHVLARRGRHALVYMETKILRGTITVWAELRLTSSTPRPDTVVVEASMVKGNVERMDARWEMQAIDRDHTRIAFQVLMDPGIPLLPKSRVDYFEARASKQMIEGLQRTLRVQPTGTEHHERAKRGPT